MHSFIYPKLLREELAPAYADSPAARSRRVNLALTTIPAEELSRHGLRRARQVPPPGYEPFSIAISDEAMRVLNGLPGRISRSALIQWILRTDE